MNKQELIDKAVERFHGEWPFCMEGMISTADDLCWSTVKLWSKGGDSASACKSEFEQRARELGWVNGYKWGVEYPTNGKKPDLPDDVVVDIRIDNITHESNWRSECGLNIPPDKISEIEFDSEVAAFRIVDERYKPVEVEQVQADTNTTEFGKKDFPQDYSFIVDAAKDATNQWYDYDKQQAIGFAPEKTRCQVQCGESWQGGLLIASHGDSGWFLSDCGGTFFLTKERFRPLDYNRKADEERRRLEQKKKIEFIDMACKGMLTKTISNAQLKTIKRLYDLGCRFK